MSWQLAPAEWTSSPVLCTFITSLRPTVTDRYYRYRHCTLASIFYVSRLLFKLCTVMSGISDLKILFTYKKGVCEFLQLICEATEWNPSKLAFFYRDFAVMIFVPRTIFMYLLVIINLPHTVQIK